MLTPVFKGFVSDDGRLLLADREAFRKYLQGQCGKHVEVIVRLVKKMRSKPQNDYVHAVLFRTLANEWGWEEREMKEYLLVRFAPRKHAEKGPGKIIRTSEMTTVQLNEFCERVRRWAMIEHQVNLPEPNEVIID